MMLWLRVHQLVIYEREIIRINLCRKEAMGASAWRIRKG